ncbi:MAG TPA: 2-keto-4-pentenoate hydratase [Terracidiphilus sp.]|jgi:2-keto-4-pentenoate hydratase|nr:2-keto-4-pentenoate hydratase [Terracidiphilus sp.]
MTSPTRESELTSAAELFLEARRAATPFAELPANLAPASLEEAYFVQDLMYRALEPVGALAARAWKVGAPAADATPLFGPMITAWIKPSPALFDDPRHRLRGLEAEIAFLIGDDLPPRAAPYTRDELVHAVESCHPAIEELEAGLTVPAQAARFSMIADLQMHGGFIYGPAVSNWQQIDFVQESVSLAVDGAVQVERTASNTAGTDLLRLLLYLVNEGASRTSGLRRGSWVTTGSWTGNTFASAGSQIDVRFSTAGAVSLRFA